jgi:hypothetical protein
MFSKSYSKYPVNPLQLIGEIITAAGKTLVNGVDGSLDYHDADEPDNLVIALTVDPDAAEELAIDNAVDNHVAVPTPIYRLTDNTEDPSELDYDIRGLHKKRTLKDGFLIKCEYFRTSDGTTYSGLAVEENRVYTVTPGTDLVSSRAMTIDWYRDDGSIGSTKKTVKYYSFVEQIAEGKTRRNNVVEYASLYLISKVGIPNAQDFLRTVAALMSLYVAGSRQELVAAVQGATQGYMTADPAIIPTLVAILNYVN